MCKETELKVKSEGYQVMRKPREKDDGARGDRALDKKERACEEMKLVFLHSHVGLMRL